MNLSTVSKQISRNIEHMLKKKKACSTASLPAQRSNSNHVGILQIHDQGLVNMDPRFIYVPFHGINLIPTDIRGLTYNRCALSLRTLDSKSNPVCRVSVLWLVLKAAACARIREFALSGVLLCKCGRAKLPCSDMRGVADEEHAC